jgi:Domain of unknown function (DUF4203)
MQLFTMGLGLILLVFGRKLFWLCVAVLGFFLGMEFAGVLLVDQPRWAMLLIGLGAGLLGALLAVLAERVAFALAGFYAGAYLALEAARSFGTGDHSTLWLLAGGAIGAVLAALIMDWAIIVLSSLVGAGAIVGATSMGPTTAALVFVVLTVVGIVVQEKLMAKPRYHAPH